ncbi:MAG: flavodoxin domain-containing protein [bacterium]
MRIFLWFVMIFFLFPVVAEESEEPEKVQENKDNVPVDAENEEKDEEGTLKTLMVYFSETGNTKKTAERIASLLEADLERIEEKARDRSGFFGFLVAGKDAYFGNVSEIKTVSADLEKYDLIIMGTPIWAWSITPALRAFIKDNKKILKNKRVVFFTTSGGTDVQEVKGDVEEILKKPLEITTNFLEEDVGSSAAFLEKTEDFVRRIKKTVPKK